MRSANSLTRFSKYWLGSESHEALRVCVESACNMHVKRAIYKNQKKDEVSPVDKKIFKTVPCLITEN